jgi:hypothetical protein
MSAFDFDLSIIIDDFKFTLISKTVASNKGYYCEKYHLSIQEERKKVVITSEEISGGTEGVSVGEKKRFYAYSSVSQLGTWRLCILDEQNRLLKFDNYIQATLLDVRLQNFINMNFDFLPYADSSDTFSRRLTVPERNQIIQELEENNFDKSEIERVRGAYTYEEGVNPNGVISCLVDTNDMPSMINGRWKTIFPFVLNLVTMKEKSDFIEFNYNLVEDSLKKILEFDIQLDVYKANVEMYEITASNKNVNRGLPKNIVFQVGKFTLDLERGEKREGYYIFNIIEPSTKINCYGLYSNYISGTFQNPYTNLSKPEDNYITKPLNYTDQPLVDNQHQISRDVVNVLEDIGSQHYFFTAYKNDDVFPIKEINGLLKALPAAASESIVPFFEQSGFDESSPIDPVALKKMKKLWFLGGGVRRRKSKKRIRSKQRNRTKRKTRKY